MRSATISVLVPVMVPIMQITGGGVAGSSRQM
jgi:hypothetical protein